jgi:hypothetical protein
MQEKHSLLTTRIQELENEYGRLKEWQVKTSRYELREIAPGVLRALKDSGG